MVTMEELRKMFGDEYNTTRKMVVTKLNGTKEIVRLWLGNSTALHFKYVAICKKGCPRSSRYLTSYDIENWLSIKPATEWKLTLDLYDKRVRKAIDMLDRSGLWMEIKTNLLMYLKMNKAHRQELINDILENEYEKFYLECAEGKKYWWVHFHQIFVTLTKERCWTSVPLPTYEPNKTTEKFNIQNAILKRENYSGRWRNKYDVSVDLEVKEDGIYRGWLSCEYRGCANGHYYLLFDATHAIFYEDD